MVFPKVFLVFFGIFRFSLIFVCVLKTSGKTKKQKNKPTSKGGSATFKNIVCLVFPKVFLVVFGFLCIFGFPYCFLKKTLGKTNNQTNKTHIQGCVWNLEKHCLFGFPEVFVGFLWCSLIFVVFPKVFLFLKTLGETKKSKKTNPYPKVGLKPLNILFVWFSRRLFWFSLVFVCIVGFLEGLLFSNNFRENQKIKKKNISKGGSETFKNFVCLVFPNVFFCFCFVFFCICWFSRRFFWFSKNLRENQNHGWATRRQGTGDRSQGPGAGEKVYIYIYIYIYVCTIEWHPLL